MYVRGDRICEIQSWLQDNKILTVGELRYRRTGSTRHPRPQLEAYYNWPDKTLYDILSRKEYLGHTITGKTRKVSYKSKKTIKNPEDKQYFFPNTHEALIDEETFELAQKRISTKQRPTKVDEIDLFSGIVLSILGFGGYGLGEVGENYARAAICQMDTLHYLLVNATGEAECPVFPTMYAFQGVIASTGCQSAYALDGGQTAAMMINGELINSVFGGYQRKISNVIYFCMALPNA